MAYKEKAVYFDSKFALVSSIDFASYLYVPNAIEAERLRTFCESVGPKDIEHPFYSRSFGLFYWDRTEKQWVNIDYKIDFFTNVKKILIETVTEII